MDNIYERYRKNRRAATIIILAALMTLSVYGTAGSVGVTHNVYGKLFNTDGSVPGDDEVIFTAYVSSRPKERVTHPGSVGSGYKDGWWVVNVGNFPTPWKIGDVLVVEFFNMSNGEWAIMKKDVAAQQAGEIIVDLTRETPPKYLPRYR